ncbi:MAG TPA: hypothetical protein VID27_17345, partial [Blastocatellia bacterium]
LLGALTEEEKLRVEERFFTDNDFYEQLLAVENELKYDYAQGHLSLQEKRSFEDRFLKHRADSRRAEMAGVLLKKVSEASPVVQSDSNRWLNRLMSAVGLRSALMQYALVALALVMAATSAWFIYRTVHLRGELEETEIARAREEERMERLLTEERARNEQLAEELERERSKQNSSPGKIEKPAVSAAVSVALKPGLEREGGKVRKLQLQPEVEQVRIQLDVRAEGDYQSYRASIQTPDGEEIWSRSRLRARNTPSGRFVFLSVDATILDAGDYVIILKGVKADHAIEDVGDYYLTIVKK